MWRAHQNLFNCIQREDKDMKSHCDRFENAVEVPKTHGADVGSLHSAWKDNCSTSLPELEDRKNIEHEDLLGIKCALSQCAPYS